MVNRVEMALGKVGELGNFIREQRTVARLSLRKLSNMAGISNPYLSQIERGMRRPSAEILQAIAKSLRISAETLYVKAGILEERGDEADPLTAILRDLAITDKQKQVLIEIYQSFRHENELEGSGTAGRVARATAPKATAPTKTTARKKAPAPRTSLSKTSQRSKTRAKPQRSKKTAAARKSSGTKRSRIRTRAG